MYPLPRASILGHRANGPMRARYANSTLNFRPKASAACSRTSSVTDGFFREKRRSIFARLVFMRLASLAREILRRWAATQRVGVRGQKSESP